MGRQKFSVFLMPLDEGGYQVFFPYHPQCITDGRTVDEALNNATELMEDLLRTEAEEGGDPVPPYVYAGHVLVGTVDIEVPDSLLKSKQPARPAAPRT